MELLLTGKGGSSSLFVKYVGIGKVLGSIPFREPSKETCYVLNGQIKS